MSVPLGQNQSRIDTTTVNSENKTAQQKIKASRMSLTNGGKRLDTYLDPEYWYHKGVVLN